MTWVEACIKGSYHQRLAFAFHEVGHAAMTFWRSESLHCRWAEIRGDGSAAAFHRGPALDLGESDLAILIGGPMAECLACGFVPKRAIRFPSEYRNAGSDSSRIRRLVRLLRGKDDRAYQFAVQEKVRAILEGAAVWAAITQAAEELTRDGRISGERLEDIFDAHGVEPQLWGELDEVAS
jgi:hypothetical protein